jgi:hypothetical protein
MVEDQIYLPPWYDLNRCAAQRTTRRHRLRPIEPDFAVTGNLVRAHATEVGQALALASASHN